MIDMIKIIFTIPVVQGHDLYPGLPTFSLRNKTIQFNYLKERVAKRMQGWSSKIFSVGGKEVLIKSALQAIPTYAMSCFWIPSSICSKIEKDCDNFWWGMEESKRDGRRCIERTESLFYVVRSVWEVWAFENWMYSIKLFWRNNCGEFSEIPILLSLVF